MSDDMQARAEAIFDAAIGIDGSVRPTQRLTRRMRRQRDEQVAPPAAALDLRALAGSRAPPREWINHLWIPHGHPVLLAGGPGKGKSLLVQQWLTALSIGRDYIGSTPAPRRVLYWSCEDDHNELWRRQEDISQYFEIALDAPAGSLHIVPRFGRDNTLMAPLQMQRGSYAGTLSCTSVFEELKQQLNDLEIDVLALDNIAHVFGGNPIDRNQVTTFINTLAGLRLGLTVILVGHPARAQGSEYADSIAWEASCRTRLYFGDVLPDQQPRDDDAPPATDVRYLSRRKANYSPLDYMKLTLRNGVLVPDFEPDRISGLASAINDRRAEDTVIAAYRSLLAMGIPTTDANNSRDYLPKQAIAKGLAGGFAKHELTRALDRLMTRGVFARGVVGQYSNRTPRPGLVLNAENLAAESGSGGA